MADFLIFNQELIALLKAGLPVVRSFEILLERQKSPVLRRVLTDVRERVNSGASISEAFAEEGDLFPRLYWTSLKAGEKSGEIEAVLRRYLKYQKTVIALTRKVVSTLVYPVILIALSARADHDPDDLRHPALHRVLRRLRRRASAPDGRRARNRERSCATTSWSSGRPSAAGASSPGAGSRPTAGRVWLDGAILKLPVVGGIFRRFAITQFTRSLGTLLGGGTPLVPALENASDAIGNRSVSIKVASVVPRVREGRELWKALEATGIFTDLTIEMIKVGESSGALEEMLAATSEFYDEEIDLLLARVISFVEPAILVIMGGVIVTILLSVYLPMFRLMSAIKS